MYDLPNQTLQDFLETVYGITNLTQGKPEHISLYGLILEENTAFAKKGVAPDQDLAAEMYEWVVEYLVSQGYEHYEISNFALPGFRCLHNQLYWTDQPYLGLGCGASSYWEGKRWTNTASLQAYCDALEKGQEPPLREKEILEGASKLGEKLILGLRLTQGIHDPEAEKTFEEEIRKFVEWGLLERRERSLRLTARGRLLANQVFSAFVV